MENKTLEERVKELEHQIDELEDNLIHDTLTGLKTRAFFDHEVSVYLEIISQQLQLQANGFLQRKQHFGFRNLSVIFFDIDHFKKVNDTHGHDMGDVVLKKIASVISVSLRTGDTAARWGGEEIIVNLLGASEQDAAAKAEEIRQKVEELEFTEIPGFKITISAGVASSQEGVGLEALVKHADEALYRAKETGRNKVVSYSALATVPEAVA
ncbi:MAG: PAS/PAC sensor-containing diguanylate cyclase [Parcubacteria group bacterium GW2011_GWB1_49_7]|uniref:GGDEF domain-containing protein n=1 Tax=Candidatus Zambryskibacteria bacterium RIFCSPHIGHO2_01_FULL_46_25 TaxID=1802738 RepID=A0A1G2SZ47_9BACT|nr:MAG: PAS/PAC sensor-containing diguanylate cyclase [Parcubacteria group bacterium GW2011_GWA1_47_10]KKW09766.1 MAG: PAS/PAC sensor-containing diguanylate cyclase [Parcubacteria group bacterium GW2011_GWB1_49_7]OHA90320.1 MAG: hypothetical protein A2838_01835 [Candidatus Zambryskibacteria bacterium RIFCSPHIGHO2_01_FULL_46_25]OHB06861.1 MAG: hypothetical protein A3A31_00985 [Candidatus Zambryskibacteria bacterium RIFCSPLOWO2_01_FULL_48_25]